MEQFKPPAKSTIYKKIKECGVSKAILKRVLPLGWNESKLATLDGLSEFSQCLADRLGIDMHVANCGKVQFCAQPMYMQFKKRTTTDYSKLSDAAILVNAYGKAFINVLKSNNKTQLLEEFFCKLSQLEVIDLDKVVFLLWEHHIPVLYLDDFPSAVPRPAGVILKEDGLYVIVLSHKHKSPSTQLFVLLHEIGHLKYGHIKGTGLISDSSVSALGESLKEETDQQEIEADLFALDTLRCGVDVVSIIKQLGYIQRPAELALQAQKLNRSSGIHPGHFVLSYGRETRNWILAQQALKFLERGDAQATFKVHFREALDKYQFGEDEHELLQRLM